MQKQTDLLLFQLEQTRELRPLRVILLTDPRVSEKTGMNYVAQKLSGLSATAGKETSSGDGPLLLW